MRLRGPRHIEVSRLWESGARVKTQAAVFRLGAVWRPGGGSLDCLAQHQKVKQGQSKGKPMTETVLFLLKDLSIFQCLRSCSSRTSV